MRRRPPTLKGPVSGCLSLSGLTQKGIRSESGTTAITVFDVREHMPLGKPRFSEKAVLPAYPVSRDHKSGYLPYFQKV